jgi:hypothetical protein
MWYMCYVITHVPVAAVLVLNTPDDGRLRPKHVDWPRTIKPAQCCIKLVFSFDLTSIGLSPGGSAYFTCKWNMKLVTTKFKSGGLHERHVVATWNLGNRLSAFAYRRRYFALCKVPFFCQTIIKIKSSLPIFGKFSNTKFRENPSSRIRVVPCGQTDGLTDITIIIAAFRNFCERSCKKKLLGRIFEL